MSWRHGHASHQRYNGPEFGTDVPGNTGEVAAVAKNANVSPVFNRKVFCFIFTTFRPQDAAASLIQVVQRAKSGSVWVMEGQEVYEMETPERWELRKKDE